MRCWEVLEASEGAARRWWRQWQTVAAVARTRGETRIPFVDEQAGRGFKPSPQREWKRGRRRGDGDVGLAGGCPTRYYGAWWRPRECAPRGEEGSFVRLGSGAPNDGGGILTVLVVGDPGTTTEGSQHVEARALCSRRESARLCPHSTSFNWLTLLCKYKFKFSKLESCR